MIDFIPEDLADNGVVNVEIPSIQSNSVRTEPRRLFVISVEKANELEVQKSDIFNYEGKPYQIAMKVEDGQNPVKLQCIVFSGNK